VPSQVSDIGIGLLQTPMFGMAAQIIIVVDMMSCNGPSRMPSFSKGLSTTDVNKLLDARLTPDAFAPPKVKSSAPCGVHRQLIFCCRITLSDHIEFGVWLMAWRQMREYANPLLSNISGVKGLQRSALIVSEGKDPDKIRRTSLTE
jgi:hypothetical protein